MRSFWQGKTHPWYTASLLIFNTLLLLKIWGLLVSGLQRYRPSNFKNDLTPGILESGRVVQVGPGPVSRLFLRPPTLKASNFKVLKPTDPVFTVIKDLNLLKKQTKNQEASYNFSLSFALSNRTHFNSVLYYLGVWHWYSETVPILVQILLNKVIKRISQPGLAILDSTCYILRR